MISYIDLGGCQTFVLAYVTLACMHILASLLGWGVAFVIPAFWTKLVCAIVFILIGIGMLVYAFYMADPKGIDEAFGRSGHATKVEASVPTTVKVAEEADAPADTEKSENHDADDTKKEGGDKDKSDASESSSEEEGSHDGDSSSRESGSNDSDEDESEEHSDENDKGEEDESSEEEEDQEDAKLKPKGEITPVAGAAPKPVERQTTVKRTDTTKGKSKAEKTLKEKIEVSKSDKDGIH